MLFFIYFISYFLIFLNKKIFLRKKLREIKINIWGGKTYEYIKNKYKDQFNKWQINQKYRLPGLESHYQIKKRIKNEIINIVSQNNDMNKIIIISHGMAIRSFLASLFEEDEINYIDIKNCSVTNINLIKGEFFLEDVNLYKHFSCEAKL